MKKKSEGSSKIKKETKPRKPKVSDKLPVIIELPIDQLEMEIFVERNREYINTELLNSFEYAVKHNASGIEVFSFTNSNYVVIVNKWDFRENIQNIFDYCLEREMFESCAKAKRVMELMDKFSFSMNCKKQ